MTPSSFQKNGRLTKTRARHRELSTGARKLPSLLFRSLLMLSVLYGALTLLLIIAVELGFLSAAGALIFGITSAALQFLVGPWILDLTLRFLYRAHWVDKSNLPEHLQAFVQRVCDEESIPFPHFAIIDDGAPQAFTYGHCPKNARVVLSRGTLSLLSPAESESVVAHELGHVCHWDMVVMTIAQLVPLIAYAIYRAAAQLAEGKNKERSAASFVQFGAYLVYICSELVVLWFSRIREYYADQFAGEKTGNPNALASALVKIGYGLAGSGSQDAGSNGKERGARSTGISAFNAFNIFDRKSALGLVVTTAGSHDGSVDPERVKDALQWDLWSPWALYYEVQSTHPLIAKRLERLGDQAVVNGQSPFILFDREQPESYWDEFAVDILVIALPLLGVILGVGFLISSVVARSFNPHLLGIPLALHGAGSLLNTFMAYRSGNFHDQSVADLLQEVKVSPVRSIPASLRGTIVGKGVPGLLFSEDFVMQDKTGIIFVDYRQPIPLWDFFFGLLKAGSYQGKEVEVHGWYRRAPVPYLEISSITTIQDGTRRSCYTRTAKLAWGFVCAIAGVAILL